MSSLLLTEIRVPLFFRSFPKQAAMEVWFAQFTLARNHALVRLALGMRMNTMRVEKTVSQIAPYARTVG